MDNAALKEKRERQARRLLTVCLRPISTPCLEAYVEGFEAGTLKALDPRLCALGHMGRGCGGDGRPYTTMSFGPHQRESDRIERIFEGLTLRLSLVRWWDDGGSTDADRASWIYDACLEELARRGGDVKETEPAESLVKTAP